MRRLERILHAGAGGFGAAEPRPENGHVELRVVGFFDGEHQSGFEGVKGRNVFGEGVDRDESGTHGEGRARGEDRGAEGAAGAARDDEAAEVALVDVLGAAVKNVREFVFFDDGECRERNRDVEFEEMNFSHGVDAFLHIKARLGGEEGERRVGAAPRTRADPLARIRIESRGNVKRHLEGLAFVEPEDGVEIVARYGLGLSHPEEAVDDAVGLFREVGVVRHGAARFEPFGKEALGKFGLGFAAARQDDGRRKAALFEFEGGDERVSAVVARTHEERHASAFGNAFGNEIGRGRPGAQHEGVVAEHVARARFEAAVFVDREDGFAHWVQFL